MHKPCKVAAMSESLNVLHSGGKLAHLSSDSGISDGSPGQMNSDTEPCGPQQEEKLTKNISQIEALLKRINDENKKTKEVLERIDRGEFRKEKKLVEIKPYLVKKEVEAMEVKKEDEKEEEPAEPTTKSRVSFSGSWANDKAEDITWASSMEQKRYPIVVFSPLALSQPSPNPVGSRYHLTFKVVQADAKIVSQIFHAHGFHEVGSLNQDFNLMWTGSHPKPQSFKSMLPHQRVNHFPRSYELTRKDRMYKNIERLQIAKGPKHFNFIPKTFMIPNEYSEFAATHHRMRGMKYFSSTWQLAETFAAGNPEGFPINYELLLCRVTLHFIAFKSGVRKLNSS